MSLIDIQIQSHVFPTGFSSNYDELNVLLAKDDYIETRCGEIFMSRCNVLIFLCSECNENFASYDEFFNHLCEQHVSIKDEQKYDPFDEDILDPEYYNENQVKDEDPNVDVKPSFEKEDLEKEIVSQDEFSQDCTYLQHDEISQDGMQGYEGIEDYEYAFEGEEEGDKTVTFLNNFSKLVEKDYQDIVSNELREQNSIEPTTNSLPDIDPFGFDCVNDYTKFECDRCQKAFDSASKLKTHAKSHTKDRRFKCHVCGFAFTEQFNLRSHLKRHDGTKPFPCALCEKRFITKNELKAHERIHTGERPYICEVCGHGFVTSGSLNEHRKRHNNYRPHKCSFCDKSFFDTGMLREHMVVHTGERTHVCQTCNAGFTRRKALLQHLKLHSGLKQYKCTYCDKAFAQKPGLASHLKTHRSVVEFGKSEDLYVWCDYK